MPLMEDLCTLVCPGGGRILDPLLAPAPPAVAARNKNFDCVLIEQDATMRPVIEDRVRAEAVELDGSSSPQIVDVAR